MKKIFIVTIVSCMLLTSCKSFDIGIIGGADGPTNIYVSGAYGKQYEKKPVRMFNIDGDLYYDSGLISEVEARCGTLDGELKKAVGENEIPKKSGEANFEVDGYQHATDVTKEVCIDGNWLIFKKFRSEISVGIDELKYCFYIKGRLNNAAIDSEIIVLTDNKDITFSQVYEPMLSSQFDAGKDNGTVVVEHITSGDEWGLTLYADDVTSKGMTIKFEQFGSGFNGEFGTGVWYKIEKLVNDRWQDVKAKIDNPVWNAIGYIIYKNDVTEYEINWEFLYGELPEGTYRLSKEIYFGTPGNFEKKIYYAQFDVE